MQRKVVDIRVNVTPGCPVEVCLEDENSGEYRWWAVTRGALLSSNHVGRIVLDENMVIEVLRTSSPATIVLYKIIRMAPVINIIPLDENHFEKGSMIKKLQVIRLTNLVVVLALLSVGEEQDWWALSMNGHKHLGKNIVVIPHQWKRDELVDNFIVSGINEYDTI